MNQKLKYRNSQIEMGYPEWFIIIISFFCLFLAVLVTLLLAEPSQSMKYRLAKKSWNRLDWQLWHIQNGIPWMVPDIFIFLRCGNIFLPVYGQYGLFVVGWTIAIKETQTIKEVQEILQNQIQQVKYMDKRMLRQCALLAWNNVVSFEYYSLGQHILGIPLSWEWDISQFLWISWSLDKDILR